MASEWLIPAELAILIFVVWNGLRRIESTVLQGLQRAGLAKPPEGKCKCVACDDIVYIPSMEDVCLNCREGRRST
jgi:hypothetical protein